MRRRRISACEAKAELKAAGIDFREDYHALRSSQVEKIADMAARAGYRKSRTSQSSLGRAGSYFYALARKRGC